MKYNEKEQNVPGSQFDWDFIKNQTNGVDLFLEDLNFQLLLIVEL